MRRRAWREGRSEGDRRGIEGSMVERGEIRRNEDVRSRSKAGKEDRREREREINRYSSVRRER